MLYFIKTCFNCYLIDDSVEKLFSDLKNNIIGHKTPYNYEGELKNKKIFTQVNDFINN
jgi:hypothetical protein